VLGTLDPISLAKATLAVPAADSWIEP